MERTVHNSCRITAWLSLDTFLARTFPTLIMREWRRPLNCARGNPSFQSRRGYSMVRETIRYTLIQDSLALSLSLSLSLR